MGTRVRMSQSAMSMWASMSSGVAASACGAVRPLANTADSTPSSITNLKLVILASEPQGNGIRSAYSKAAAFTDLLTPLTTAIDIKTDYDKKNGTPTAGNPKVFFRYFYVNTATGEKSADMYASAKLSA